MDARHASAPLALCGIFALTLGLSACGNSSLSSGEATASPAVPSETKAAALAAMVPAKIKSAGKIVVGVDASYAPNEFLASDGTTVKGMDVDLFNAVGQTLGLKVDWQPAEVRLHHHRCPGGQVRRRRLQLHDQPPAQAAGQHGQLLQRRHPVGDGAGQPQEDQHRQPLRRSPSRSRRARSSRSRTCPSRSAKCKAAGKPINTLVYTGQDQVTAAVATGKADAMLADSPVVAYAVKQSGGKVEPARRHLRRGPVRHRGRQVRHRVRQGHRRRVEGDRHLRRVQEDPRQLGQRGRRDHRASRSTPDGP